MATSIRYYTLENLNTIKLELGLEVIELHPRQDITSLGSLAVSLGHASLPSPDEEIQEVDWSKKHDVEVHDVEEVLFNLPVLEHFELIITPLLDLVNDLSRVNSLNLVELTGKEKTLCSKHFQIH